MDTNAAFALLSQPVDDGTNQVPATFAPASTPTNNLAPLTDQAAKQSFNEMLKAQNMGPLRKEEVDRREKYIAGAQQDNVPLDIDTGVSPWEKFVMGFHREKDNQIKYLQGKYGEDNVRSDQNGQLIVRVADSQTGKPKDLKVDEWNMSAKDLLEVAGSVPEIAAGVMAALAMKKAPGIGQMRGFMGLQRDVASTALGAETAGAAKDIASSVQVKGEKGFEDIPKIAGERGAMAVGDVALGELTMGVGGVPNTLKKIAQSSRGEVQLDTLGAQKYFKEKPKYNKKVPLSLGESTGAPIVARTEAFTEKLPGGGTPFQKLRAEQEQSLRDIQNIMMGKVPATDEAVGQSTIDALMQKIAPVQEEVSAAQKTLGKVGTKQIENIVAGATMPERQVFQNQAGKEIRDAVTAKRDAAKAEADRLFDEVRAAPGGEGKTFDAGPLKGRFQQIMDRLPAPEHTTQVPTGIVGPDGTPILRTQTGQSVLKEFVPPNVLARLKSVTEMKNAKYSLSDLQQMRREVYDDISKGEGVPGLGTHYLNDIGKAITGAIDDGIAKMPTGELRTSLDAANKHYKEKVLPFNRQGITELFKAPDEAGHISDSEVVDRLFAQGKAVERYDMMKETLGANSPEFDKLKRAMADKIISSSRLVGDSLIDPKKLVQNLTALRTEADKVAQDMFGGKINEMFRQAKFLEYAQGAKVDAGELKGLLKDKSPTVKAFKALVDAEKQRDKLYQNEILKGLSTGDLSKNPINPEEFVNRFLEDSKPSDMKAIMYMLRGNKPLVEDLRAKTVEKIFRDASRSATPSDIGRLMSGDPTRIVTGTSTYKQIEAGSTREKIKTILGPDTFEDLRQYILLQAGTEFKEQQFKGAGGLAAGMEVSNLVKRGPLRYLYHAGKEFVVAQILTREPLREFLSSMPVSRDPKALQMLLTSAPFVEAVMKEMPGKKGVMFMSSVQQSIDRYLNVSSQSQQQRQPVVNDPAAKRKAAESLLDQGLQ